MVTGINNEDRLVQRTVADHLHDQLGWDSVYAWNDETFGASGTLGRTNERDVVLVRDLREAMVGLNPGVPSGAIDDALRELTTVDFAESTIQHNQRFYTSIREGVPVSWRDSAGQTRRANLRCIDFLHPGKEPFFGSSRVEDSGVADAALQPSGRSRLLRQRAAGGLHRAEGSLRQYPRWLRQQHHGLQRHDPARLSSQRVSDRQ